MADIDQQVAALSDIDLYDAKNVELLENQVRVYTPTRQKPVSTTHPMQPIAIRILMQQPPVRIVRPLFAGGIG